jgi:hypothetical protein
VAAAAPKTYFGQGAVNGGVHADIWICKLGDCRLAG